MKRDKNITRAPMEVVGVRGEGVRGVTEGLEATKVFTKHMASHHHHHHTRDCHPLHIAGRTTTLGTTPPTTTATTTITAVTTTSTKATCSN